MNKSIRKVGNIIAGIILAVVLIVTVLLVRTEITKRSYYQKFYPIVKEEFEKISIDQKLGVVNDDVNHSTCSYDGKMRFYRCPISFRGYYTIKESPPEKLAKMKESMEQLGWKSTTVHTKEDDIRMFEKYGYMPFIFMEKTAANGLNLQLHISFLEKDDSDNVEPSSLRSQVENSLENGEYVFYISVSSDIINQ